MNGCRLVVVIPIVWELCVWLRPVGVVSIASCSIQQRTSHRYAWAYFLAIESFRLLFSDAPQHFYSSPRNFYHFNRDSTRSETTLDIIEIIFFSLPSPLLFLFLFFFGLKQHRILILSIEAPLFFPGVYNRFLSFPTRFRALEIILFDVNEYNA